MSDTTPLCECGCGQPAPIADRMDPLRGYVTGQPRRFVHGHNARNSQPRLILPHHYAVDAESGCWNWLGYIAATGYGKRGRVLVHRLSYEQFRKPIPPGLVIDHLCRNRRCLNPDHLDVVTPAENIRRGWMGKKLTPTQARAIRIDPRKHAVIAAEYGVDDALVGRIKARKAWARA